MKLEATINDIIQTLEDGQKGFASAAEKAEKDGRQDLAIELRQYSDQRAMFSNELRTHAAAARSRGRLRAVGGRNDASRLDGAEGCAQR